MAVRQVTAEELADLASAVMRAHQREARIAFDVRYRRFWKCGWCGAYLRRWHTPDAAVPVMAPMCGRVVRGPNGPQVCGGEGVHTGYAPLDPSE